MGFSMPACASTSRWPGVWLLGALLCWVGPAAGSEFAVRAVDTYLKDEVYHLDADVSYSLSPDVLEALENGVPLNMHAEIEVYEHNRWWWDSEVAALEQRYRLQYHALTERYVVENLNSGAQQTHTSLSAALDTLGEVRGLPLLDRELLAPDERYWARMRVELDIEALPAPLRPLAYLSSQWRLGSEWYDWSLQD